MQQLTLRIHNDNMLEKIVQILNVFKNDGVEIEKIETEIDNQEKYRDEYIKKHWRELIITSEDNSDYYKSEQYMMDRAKDWMEGNKV